MWPQQHWRAAVWVHAPNIEGPIQPCSTGRTSLGFCGSSEGSFQYQPAPCRKAVMVLLSHDRWRRKGGQWVLPFWRAKQNLCSLGADQLLQLTPDLAHNPFWWHHRHCPSGQGDVTERGLWLWMGNKSQEQMTSKGANVPLLYKCPLYKYIKKRREWPTIYQYIWRNKFAIFP